MRMGKKTMGPFIGIVMIAWVGGYLWCSRGGEYVTPVALVGSFEQGYQPEPSTFTWEPFALPVLEGGIDGDGVRIMNWFYSPLVWLDRRLWHRSYLN